MKAYRIKDAKQFETSETGKLKNLSWVPLPNRHDGKGYRRLLRSQDGPLMYAAWIAMLTVASKCKPRWVLADDDGPLTAEDLSIKTDIPAEAFTKAFKALVGREIGWLDEVEVDGVPLESAGVPADSPEVPAENPVVPARKKEGKEGKEEKPLVPDKPAPVVAEVFNYWQTVMDHPQAKLTPEREKAVRARLKQGYSVDQLKRAIDGCRGSPFHMGENGSKARHDDLEQICRKGSQVEKFIAMHAQYAVSSDDQPSNEAAAKLSKAVEEAGGYWKPDQTPKSGSAPIH